MMLTEIKDIIDFLKDVNSDTTYVEIKSCKGGFPKRLWETLSAFANTQNGGVILLGITETSDGIKVTGVNNPAQMQSELEDICSKMVPPLRPLIEIHRYEGKMLVTAEIPDVSYKDKPCYYQGSGLMSGAFIRVSDGDRQLTQYEVQGFLDGRGQPRYDLEPIPDSSIEDLDRELVELLVDTVKTKQPKTNGWDTQSILKTYHVITAVADKEVATLSGILCLGAYPQKFFPGLSVHILSYPTVNEGYTGSHGERLSDNIKIEGPILRIMPEIIRALKRNLQKKTVVRGLLREDVLEYPEIFLREAYLCRSKFSLTVSKSPTLGACLAR